MSCLQLELRSHIHLMVVMSLLAQKVPSYLLGGVLWSFIAQPLCLSLSFISLPYLWYGICCGVFLSVPLSLDELLGGYLYCLYLDLMSLLWSFPFISHFLGYIVNHNSRVGNCLPFFPFLPSPLATVFPLKLLPYNRMPSDLVLQNRCSRQRFFFKKISDSLCTIYTRLLKSISVSVWVALYRPSKNMSQAKGQLGL